MRRLSLTPPERTAVLQASWEELGGDVGPCGEWAGPQLPTILSAEPHTLYLSRCCLLQVDSPTSTGVRATSWAWPTGRRSSGWVLLLLLLMT